MLIMNDDGDVAAAETVMVMMGVNDVCWWCVNILFILFVL